MSRTPGLEDSIPATPRHSIASVLSCADNRVSRRAEISGITRAPANTASNATESSTASLTKSYRLGILHPVETRPASTARPSYPARGSIPCSSEREKPYELAHCAVCDRRVDGVRSRLLHRVVLRLVDPIMATSARRTRSRVSSSGTRDWRTHWLVFPCRQRFGFNRHCGLCSDCMARFLQRACRFDRCLLVVDITGLN